MPGWLQLLLVTLGGVSLQYLYAYVAKTRWNAPWADVITAMLYRCVPDSSWPLSERLLHAVLWFLKRVVGLSMIVAGIGLLICGLAYDQSLLE